MPSPNSPNIPLRLKQLYPHSFNIDSHHWQTAVEPNSADIASTNFAMPPSLRTTSKPNSTASGFSFAQTFKEYLFPQLQDFTSASDASPADHLPSTNLATSISTQQRMLLLGGWLLALFTVAVHLGSSPQARRVNATALEQSFCQTIVQSNATLSRTQLAQVLTVPERSPQSEIRAQLPQPYCQLQDIEMRAGISAQREAYPLAFDPQTWLVLLFEEGEYAGYAFQFAT